MKEKPNPSYAPIYAASMYPDLAGFFKKHGYALAVHGSLQRDFDLIAVPWIEEALDPDTVIKLLVEEFFCLKYTGEVGIKPHGRLVYTLVLNFGFGCFLDLGFISKRKVENESYRENVSSPSNK